ncbi:MAG TPA: zinc-ribbon domain containing protein [Syntrophomonadaceae bacterium]|nr:zinc-ribbon domain containing protein [Syntrophomonadaceae bacterium]
MFEDKTLVCQDCEQEFVFTAGEQEFYAEKGFENEPKRCKDCRVRRRNNRSGAGERAPREMHDAVCAECGADTQVPFKPVEGRPVLCLECFQKQRESAY